jgi:hypothetical protein
MCRTRFALLVLLAVAVRAPLVAQPLDRSGAGALTGTFVSADALTVVVRTDEDTLVTFLMEDQASVPAGLVPGTRVTVRYDVAADGRYRVVRVGAASFPPEAGSTTSLPLPPAAAPTPAPPAPSPSPPPATQDASPSARAAPSPARAAVRTAAARTDSRSADRAVPLADEPIQAASVPLARDSATAAAATSAGADAPAPSPGRDALKIGGLLLTAAGLAALAYAFARRHA